MFTPYNTIPAPYTTACFFYFMASLPPIILHDKKDFNNELLLFQQYCNAQAQNPCPVGHAIDSLLEVSLFIIRIYMLSVYLHNSP